MRITNLVSFLTQAFQPARLGTGPVEREAVSGTPTHLLRELTGDGRWELQDQLRASWYAQLTVPHGDPASFAIAHALARLPGHGMVQEPDAHRPGKFITVIRNLEAEDKPQVRAWITPYVVSEPDRSLWHYASGAHKRRSDETQVRIFAGNDMKLLQENFAQLQQLYQEGYRLAKSGQAPAIGGVSPV